MHETKTTPFAFWHVLLFGLLFQAMQLYGLVNSSSDGGDVFGRYSTRYAAFLAVGFSVAILWGFALLIHKRLEGWLKQHLTLNRAYPLLILLGALMLFIMWWDVPTWSVKAYMGSILMLTMAALIFCLPDDALKIQRWRRLMLIVFLLLIIPTLLTIFASRQFNPDEAEWADISTSPFIVGGMYTRTSLDPPVFISPVRGWFNALYGWTLLNVSFDPRVGRIWNYASDLLIYLGIGVVAARLYGRSAGWIAAGFAMFSESFWRALDYRPNQIMVFLLPVLMLLTLHTQQAQRARNRYLAAAACGFLATFAAMQIHPTGIVYAAGFSLYFAMMASWQLIKRRTLQAILFPLLAFGIGAAVGSGLFLMFNILPLGGMDAYLSQLSTGAANTISIRGVDWLNWGGLSIEIFLIVTAVLFALLRRTKSDYFLLGILFSIVAADTLFAQRYGFHLRPIYPIFVGALLVYGLRNPTLPIGENRRAVWVTASLFLLMLSWMLFVRFKWDVIGTTFQTASLRQPDIVRIGEDIRPYLTENDKILSTHELIWTLHEWNNLVSVMAEVRSVAWGEWGSREEGETGVEFWRRIDPTVIVEVENLAAFPPNLYELIEQDDWQVCHELTTLGQQVTIYRQDCSQSPIATEAAS